MASFNTFNTSDTVKVFVFPGSNDVRVSVGECDLRLSRSEWRAMVDAGNQAIDAATVASLDGVL